MVFFADDELYRVIQKDIKNDFGQVVATYTKEKIPYMVNIQPIEEKSVNILLEKILRVHYRLMLKRK